jgi:MFS family permease
MTDFRRLWTAGLATALGAHLSAVALPLIVLAATGSAAAAGLLGSVALACGLLSAIPGGAVADAFERRTVLFTCSVGALAASGGLTVTLLLTDRPPMVVLIGLGATTAVLASVQAPAVSALLVAVVPADRLGVATGRLQARTAAARLVGPLVGAALYAVARPLPFVVLTVLEAVALGCTLAVRTRSAPRRADGVAWFGWGELTAGVRFVWRRPELRTPLLVFGCGLNAAFGAAMLAAVAVGAAADPSGRLNGMMTALAGGGSLAGGLLATRLRVQARPRTMIVTTSFVATASIGALAVTPARFLGVVFAVCMCVAAVGNVAFTTLLLRRTGQDLLGRVSSAAFVVSMVAQPAGPLLGGYLYERFGAAATFLGLAAVALGASLVALSARSLRGLDEPAPAAPASTKVDA